MSETVYLNARCVKCGNDTLWEQGLGDKPLCLYCWDDNAEVCQLIAERQRVYYWSHHEAELARSSRYRRNGSKSVADKSQLEDRTEVGSPV